MLLLLGEWGGMVGPLSYHSEEHWNASEVEHLVARRFLTKTGNVADTIVSAVNPADTELPAPDIASSLYLDWQQRL